jgi:hypothetical protein
LDVRALGGDHGHGGAADITGAEAADGFDGHGEEEFTAKAQRSPRDAEEEELEVIGGEEEGEELEVICYW